MKIGKRPVKPQFCTRFVSVLLYETLSFLVFSLFSTKKVMKAPDDHESSSSDADTDIDDNLDWALDVPAVAAAAEPVPAETAAEVVQHDAKAPSLHVPICHLPRG
jgi:hypothetical protein